MCVWQMFVIAVIPSQKQHLAGPSPGLGGWVTALGKPGGVSASLGQGKQAQHCCPPAQDRPPPYRRAILQGAAF